MEKIQTKVKSITRRCLLFISFLFLALVTNAQYSGYVGDQFNIPDPPERMGYTAMNASFSSNSPHLYVSVNGTVQIRSYFTGSQVVICNVLYVRSDGTPGGNVPATLNYYVTCNARNITGLPGSVTMEEGEQLTLNWSFFPPSGDAKIDWFTSNSNVVTVGAYGKLTAKSAGTATITAQNNSGPDVYVQVTVKEGKKLVLEASPSGSEVLEGTKVALTCNRDGADIYYTLNGSTPSKSSIKYTSPVTINEVCTLKAIAYKDGYETSEVLTEKYTVKKIIAPTAIEILMPKMLIAGHSYSMRYVVTPLEATTEVTWSSDDESAVKAYADGSVYAKKLGTTIIRATTSNGVTGIFKVKVVNSMPSSTKFDDGTGALSVSSGYNHTMFVKNDGSLWACGSGGDGRLGMGSTSGLLSPGKVFDDVTAASAGWRHTLLLNHVGMVYGFGYNSDGRLGNQSYANQTSPDYAVFGAKAISTGTNHSLILMDDGSLLTCGSNTYGQLGVDKSISKRSVPGKIMGNVAMIAAGNYSSYVVKTDGTLWVFGSNQYGNLCLGDNVSSTATPTKLMDDVVFVSAFSEGNGFLAIKKDNTLWDCTYGNIRKAADDVVFAAKGYGHSVFIKKDGTLWGFGTNTYGETAGPIRGGIGGTTQYLMAEGVVNASVGAHRTFFITEDGTLWACGENDEGELGDGSITNRTTPVQILSVKDANAPVRLELPSGNIRLKRGDKLALDYTVVPKAYGGTLKWSSDDPSIATVSNGVVQGLKPGRTFINVEAENGKEDWCQVTVYADNIERTVSTSAAGYATFYDSDFAFIVPEGLTAQVVTSAVNSKLTYTTIASGSSSELIPAGVPVMLVGSQKKSSSYQLKSTWSEDTYSGTNLLRGSDEATTTTGDGYHYKLSYGKAGSALNNVFGWYWGAANGSAFQIEGHKAWLVIPKSSAARGYSIEGETLGVGSISLEDEADDVYYDLQGRRVSKPTAKGVYIKNGKKVTIN